MPTAAAADRQSAANRRIRSLLLKDVERAWKSIDTTDAIRARDALLVIVPPLVQEYGDMAATVAADFYAENRESARVRSRYRVALAPAIDPSRAEASTRWAVGPMFSDTPSAGDAYRRVRSITDRLALTQGDDTIRLNIGKDPAKPRYAWVPKGATCAFCTLKASRGAVYVSAETATAGRHDYCDCVASQVYDGDDLGYDVDHYRSLYQEGSAAADGHSMKQVLAGMRESSGLT